jgi:phosphoglycerate dehydrogenase-like enzyme
MLWSSEPMKQLQIALEQRYATKKNIARIAQIAAGARTAVFAIQERYPSIRKVRGLFRRILPFCLYDPLSKILDRPSEAQELLWINPSVSSSEMNNVLLFPPGLGTKVAERLLTEYPPHWVHSVMTGVDQIPSLPTGTLLTSSRGVHSRRIAEFTLGLIFALSKNIVGHTIQTRRRSWKTLPSTMVRGSRLGIVGLGSIGTEIARLGRAVGMEVWGTKRKVMNVDVADRVLSPEGLPWLLREADYVVLSVPLIQETHKLIGKEELSMMKPSSYLINVSRGAVVDEDSLYHALKNFHIRGACIDVFQGEKPLPKNSRFYRLNNLLVTSFSAFYSADSKDEVMDLFFENLRRFLVGEPLRSVIDQPPPVFRRPS